MTSPNSIPASIHNLPPAAQAQQQELTQQQLEAFGSQFIQGIVKALLALVTGGLLNGTTSQAALHQFANIFANLVKLMGIANPASLAVDSLDIAATLENWVTEVLIPLGLLVPTTEYQILVDILNGFQSLLSGGSTTADPLSFLKSFLDAGRNELDTVMTAVGTVAQQLLGQIADLQGQLKVHSSQIAALQTAGSVTPTGSQFIFNGSLGTSWTTLTGTPVFVPSDGVLRPHQLWAGRYNVVPATDTHGITITLQDKMPGTIRGVICADTGFTNYAGLEIFANGLGNDYARICVGSSYQVAVAEVQDNSYIAGGYTYSLEYDASTNTFIVLANGAQILTWEDTGNLVTHGTTKRNTGLIMSINNSFGFGDQGFGVAAFSNYDWTP